MTKLYISFAADIIAIVLIIRQLVHIKKHSDEKEAIGRYFGRFSGIVLFISVLHLLKTYADLSMGVITQEDFGKLSGSEEALWYWIQIAAGIIDIFLTAAVSCVSIPMALRSQWGFWFFYSGNLCGVCRTRFLFLDRVSAAAGLQNSERISSFFQSLRVFCPGGSKLADSGFFELGSWGAGHHDWRGAALYFHYRKAAVYGAGDRAIQYGLCRVSAGAGGQK